LELQIHSFSPAPEGYINSRHIKFSGKLNIMGWDGKYILSVLPVYCILAEAIYNLKLRSLMDVDC